MPASAQSGVLPKPRELFRLVEHKATEIRKMLRAQGRRSRGREASGSMDDAVRLAELVIRLARYGRRLPAAEAIDLAWRVDSVVDMLCAEADALLAS